MIASPIVYAPTLDALFAPLGAARFFAEHWERAPAHLDNGARGERALITHEDFLAAVRARGPNPEVMCFPEHLDGELTAARLLGDPARLDDYLSAGHPLVWNRARGVWPAVDAMTAALAEALGAHVWPNVYATGTAGTAFEAHFDCHEVIAVQCAGRKRWTISEVRVNRPLDASAMESTVAHCLRDRRDEALARPLMDFVAAPGDVVYVPRGQFHNAATPSGRSLHVTFGARLPAGYDALLMVANDALGDPSLREYVPPRAADDDGALTADAVERMVDRLRAMLTVERVGAALGALQRDMVERSKAPASKMR